MKKSEAWRRINSDDVNEQMPPPDSRLELQPAERETLRLRVADAEADEPPPKSSPPKRVQGTTDERGASKPEPTVNWPAFRGANRSGIGDGPKAHDPPTGIDLCAAGAHGSHPM